MERLDLGRVTGRAVRQQDRPHRRLELGFGRRHRRGRDRRGARPNRAARRSVVGLVTAAEREERRWNETENERLEGERLHAIILPKRVSRLAEVGPEHARYREYEGGNPTSDGVAASVPSTAIRQDTDKTRFRWRPSRLSL